MAPDSRGSAIIKSQMEFPDDHQITDFPFLFARESKAPEGRQMYRNLNGRKMAFLPKFKQALNSYNSSNASRSRGVRVNCRLGLGVSLSTTAPCFPRLETLLKRYSPLSTPDLWRLPAEVLPRFLIFQPIPPLRALNRIIVRVDSPFTLRRNAATCSRSCVK